MKKQESMGKRIIAGLIDMGIKAVVEAVSMAVAASAFDKKFMNYAILVPILYFFYMAVMELVHKGQTVGRIIMQERVIGTNNKMPSPVDLVVRNIVKTMPVLVFVLFPEIWLVTLVLAGIYWLVPLVHSKNLAIHDMVGATVVCSCKVEGKSVSTVSKEMEENVLGVKNSREELGKVVSEATSRQLEFVEKSAIEIKSEVQYGIFGLSGLYEGAFLPLTRAVVMGRSHTCNLVFPEDAPRISRRHCSVTCNMTDGTFILTDLESTYGTYLGEEFKLPAGKSVLLKEGEEFYIGEKERFRVGRKS